VLRDSAPFRRHKVEPTTHVSTSAHITPHPTKHPNIHTHLHQGGGRKGLPQSFLNRFTKVVVDPLTAPDLRLIALDKARRERRQHHRQPRQVGMEVEGEGEGDRMLRVVEAMVAFNFRLAREAGPGPEQRYGRKGGPWEFNLRDVFRWAELQAAEAGAEGLAASCDGDGDGAGGVVAAALTVETAYLARLRERGDRRAARQAFEEVGYLGLGLGYGGGVSIPYVRACVHRCTSGSSSVPVTYC
jgi:hypothetical protein